jgi:hypothetical protein
MADPMRMKIVLETSTRELSPKQFFEEFGGGSVTRVSRAFDVLVEYDWLYLVRTVTGGKRRGAIEHFYRATRPVLFDDKWPDLPEPMKELFSWKIFETLGERLKEATEAGTLDAREDRHFTWTPLVLDERGWKKVIAKVDALFYFLFEEQERATVRLTESGEEPVPMTVALVAFESPEDTTKAP